MIILSEPTPLIWFIRHVSYLYSRPLNQRRALLRLPRRSPPLIQRELLQIIQVMLLQCQGHHLSFQVRAHQYLTGLQHNQARRWVIFFNLVSCKVYILVIKYNVSFCLTTSLWFTWCLLPICHHSSQPSEHPSTSDWPTSQPSESPSLSSQPSVDPTPSPSNAPTSAVSCWSVWSIVHLDFSHKVQYICFYIYSPPLNQRRALLQPRPARWVVEMFVIVYPWFYYPNQYLSYDIFVIFHFYIADLSTNVEPYCSPDQFGELLRYLSLYIHDYIIRTNTSQMIYTSCFISI